MTPLMLGVSGMRGIVGEGLTPAVALRYAAALGEWLRASTPSAPSPTVLTGRDGRAGGEIIHRAAIDGLLRSGCAVIDAGIAPTPTIAVLVDLHADAGLITTASHNPQEWNGAKCLVRLDAAGALGAGPSAARACAPPPELACQIIDRFNNAPALPVASALRARPLTDVIGPHVDAILGALGPLPPLPFRVVLDSVNASGAAAGAALLRRLGCEPVHLADDETGIFPHHPEPTRENLHDVSRAVAEHRADVGFAQDPDADRLAIVDERGHYIGEEYTLVLAALALLCLDPPPPGAIIATNLSTSRMIDDIAAEHDIRIVRTPVGEANVAAAVRREGAPLGGEGNGGVIWPRITLVRDSLSAMALVLALMHRTGRTISQLVAAIPAYAIEKHKIDASGPGAVERVARRFPGARIDRQDGARMDLDEDRAWLHVRPSNTEPILRLIAEAPTAAQARALLDEARRAITD